MKVNQKKIEKLIETLDKIVEGLMAEEKKFRPEIERTCPIFTKSARNLVHYKALRKHDLRRLQKNLQNWACHDWPMLMDM